MQANPGRHPSREPYTDALEAIKNARHTSLASRVFFTEEFLFAFNLDLRSNVFLGQETGSNTHVIGLTRNPRSFSPKAFLCQEVNM